MRTSDIPRCISYVDSRARGGEAEMVRKLRIPPCSSRSWLPSLTTNALAFGAASFASSVLCTLFSMYVTPVFTSVYQARSPRRWRDSAFSWATRIVHNFRRTNTATEPVLNQAHTCGLPLCVYVLVGGSSALWTLDVLIEQTTNSRYQFEFEVCSFLQPTS